MSRKLASIVRIRETRPIKDADRIEIAVMEDKAWQCVTGKGEFRPGDLAVYFEVDSFLPKKDPYLFLEGRCNKKMLNEEGYRLKTIKLRGELSQGMLISPDKFPELEDLPAGTDVTEILGIRLYEAPVPACLAGEVKGAFPGFLSKSDQERLQNLPDYFERMKGVEFEITLKMDGSSMTAYAYKFPDTSRRATGICSRNLELKRPEEDSVKINTFWGIAGHLDLERRMKKLFRNIAIQGEVCGEGIQSNRCGIRGQNLFVYDIFDIDTHSYLPQPERLRLMKTLNHMDDVMIEHVPVFCFCRIFNRFGSFDEIHDWVAEQPGYNGTMCEGAVFKSVQPVNGRVVSFKVINNNYLLKYGG